jgi:hypothetical protein
LSAKDSRRSHSKTEETRAFAQMKTDLAIVAVRRPRRALGAIAGLAAFGLAVMALWGGDLPADNAPPTTIALAVLGDSSSHSYQDSLSFPPGSAVRGGAFRARTFQWTEVLARLRGDELNPGPWVRWGRPGPVAWLRGAIGLHAGRTPRKEDYLYNFARSGASCGSLIGGALQRLGQAPQLVELMDHDPGRWRSGVVIIRIGNNDWSAILDDQARDPEAPKVRAAAAYCVEQIAAAVRLIHAKHPDTRILLVGVDNEMNEPGAFDKYRSAIAIANIQTAFDDFNARLRELAGADARLGFFDLGVWFRNLWGMRELDGTPKYRAVVVGEEMSVTNTIGDEPNNAILADDHAGLVWNALWAQSLVVRLREVFDLPLTQITDEELVRFVSTS